MPCRCSAGIPASVSVRFAISPSTYDSVNFFEPITTSAAEEELIRKTGTQKIIRRKSGTQETRKNGLFKCRFLDSWFPDSIVSSFESLAVASHPLQPAFLVRFINSRCHVRSEERRVGKECRCLLSPEQ